MYHPLATPCRANRVAYDSKPSMSPMRDRSVWLARNRSKSRFSALTRCGPAAGLLDPPSGKHNVTLRCAPVPDAPAAVNAVVKPPGPREPLPAPEWSERDDWAD